MFWLRLGLKAVLCHTSDLNPALISMAITSFGMVNEYNLGVIVTLREMASPFSLELFEMCQNTD